MSKIIENIVPNNEEHVERINILSPGYEIEMLDYLLIAFTQADTDLVRHIFGDNYIELTYTALPSNMETIISDVITLDKIQKIKIDTGN